MEGVYVMRKLSKHELDISELRALRENPIIGKAITFLQDNDVEVSCFSIWKYLSHQVRNPEVNLELKDLAKLYPLLKSVKPKNLKIKSWEGHGGLNRDQRQ